MEFHFRAGEGGPRPSRFSRLSLPGDRRFTPQAGLGHLHFTGGPPPQPPQVELEAAARRERIIREEVERRLIEEEVCRELAIARAQLRGETGSEPFFSSDGPLVPPPPPGPFVGVDVPFMPPPMPGRGRGLHRSMHRNGPPPASFGSWQESRPRRCSRFGKRKLLGEARRRPLRPAKPKHEVELPKVKLEPNEGSEVHPSETKISDVKTKVNAIAVTNESTPSSEATISDVKKRKADVIAAVTEPTKLQKTTQDWSCALCQVRATSEANLNAHFEGKKHKAKLAQFGVIKVTGDCENGFQETTGNKNGGCPTDASRKICILVDGEIHEVVQKNDYLWCERCSVRCENNVTMADHLRGKKHSELNKVWKSIKAARDKKESPVVAVEKMNEDWLSEFPVETSKETAGVTHLLSKEE